PGAALIAAFLYALAGTDPYLYGNGAQLEQPINLFATAALACAVDAPGRPGRGRFLAAGAFLGAACLVRQVASVHLPVFALAALAWRGEGRERVGRRLLDALALGLGFGLVWFVAVAILAAQGALGDAVNDVVGYGAALVRDTPPEPGAPPLLVRWFTGNAD